MKVIKVVYVIIVSNVIMEVTEMACFIVPGAEAIVTTIATKIMKKHEVEQEGKINFSTKLGWLNKMLWGGSALLLFEHVWHGEVVPTFPFLTAVKDGSVPEMLAEMSSTGVLMAVIVTTLWLGMVGITSVMTKKELKLQAKKL